MHTADPTDALTLPDIATAAVIRDSRRNSRLHAGARRVAYSSYINGIQINFTSKIVHHNVDHFEI